MDPYFLLFECILGAALLIAARLSFGRPAMVGLLVFLGVGNSGAFFPELPAAWRALAAAGFALPMATVAVLVTRRGAHDSDRA
jgi:hypothetical protein